MRMPLHIALVVMAAAMSCAHPHIEDSWPLTPLCARHFVAPHSDPLKLEALFPILKIRGIERPY